MKSKVKKDSKKLLDSKPYTSKTYFYLDGKKVPIKVIYAEEHKTKDGSITSFHKNKAEKNYYFDKGKKVFFKVTCEAEIKFKNLVLKITGKDETDVLKKLEEWLKLKKKLDK